MPKIYAIAPNCYYTFELPTAPGAEVLVGSAPHCHLALSGINGLGEVHAVITCHGNHYMIADQGSPAGIYANGTPVRHVNLMPGVEYQLGGLTLVLPVEGAPPPQPWRAGAPPQMQPFPPQQMPMMPQGQSWPGAPMYQAQPMQQPVIQPVIVAAQPGEQKKRRKMRGLSPDELAVLKARYARNHPRSFPFGRIFLLIIVVLIVLLALDLLPIERATVINFLRDICNDLGKSAK